MASQADFDAAVTRVNALGAQPTDTQLKLYGLFKQATKGDATGKRPGRLDIKGRAKFDAWDKNKGTSQADAMAAYIALADDLGA